MCFKTQAPNTARYAPSKTANAATTHEQRCEAKLEGYVVVVVANDALVLQVGNSC